MMAQYKGAHLKRKKAPYTISEYGNSTRAEGNLSLRNSKICISEPAVFNILMKNVFRFYELELYAILVFEGGLG